MDCINIGDEDCWILSILRKIGAGFEIFHGGKGNCGWAGAAGCFLGDGCDCAEEDIYIDLIYLSKVDRE